MYRHLSTDMDLVEMEFRNLNAFDNKHHTGNDLVACFMYSCVVYVLYNGVISCLKLAQFSITRKRIGLIH